MTEMDACNQALNDVGLLADKYCCHQMLISHVNIIDQLLLYSNNPSETTSHKQVDPLPDGYEEEPQEEPQEEEEDEEEDEPQEDEEEEEKDEKDEEDEEFSEDDLEDISYIDDDE